MHITEVLITVTSTCVWLRLVLSEKVEGFREANGERAVPMRGIEKLEANRFVAIGS